MLIILYIYPLNDVITNTILLFKKKNNIKNNKINKFKKSSKFFRFISFFFIRSKTNKMIINCKNIYPYL